MLEKVGKKFVFGKIRNIVWQLVTVADKICLKLRQIGTGTVKLLKVIFIQYKIYTVFYAVKNLLYAYVIQNVFSRIFTNFTLV
jgi:hypothetical protein